MKKNPIRRLSALILVCVLAVSSIVVSPTDVQAAANAKKITLSTTKQIVGVGTVSYTHLDEYKRQMMVCVEAIQQCWHGSVGRASHW